ncbi:MAG: 2TM domain-containing protein [Chloroflexota bacterium]
MSDFQYDDIRRKVERRYKQRLGLIIHVVVYLIINSMFWGMWAFMTPVATTLQVIGAPSQTMALPIGFPFPLIIMVGWGAGLVAHFLSYYFRYGAGANQRDEAIQREIDQELARREQAGYLEKPKNDQRMRLSEDGELEAVPDDEISETEKRKRNR